MQLSNALMLIFTSFTGSGFGSIQFSSFLFVRPPLVIGMALCPAALPPPVALSENPGQAVSLSPLRLQRCEISIAPDNHFAAPFLVFPEKLNVFNHPIFIRLENNTLP